MMYKRAWAEIDMTAISQNIDTLMKMLKPSQLMGIVKADAYGHGASQIAHVLIHKGVQQLGVAICEEGIHLRQSGVSAPILILGFTPDTLVHEAIHLNLTQTVFSLESAREKAMIAKQMNKQATVHIKIDTGMSRLGFLPNDNSINQICEIMNNPQLNVEGIYTHCATSDSLDNTFMFEQQERFEWVIKSLEDRGVHIPVKHMANSGVFSQILRGISSDGLFLDRVRLGILLYGHPPSLEMADVCAQLGLKPAMRLLTQVSMVKKLPANVGISYGHLYKTARESTIAVLPIGYADGYPRRLSHGGQVLINGQLAPIAGAICMDQCMVDVTDIPNVAAGTEVVMLGSTETGIGADCLADVVGTISYEILCGIGKRVPRVYI